MPTDRPRLQGYLASELYKRFHEWKKERGIEKDSEALNQLLEEYFGVTPKSLSIPEIDLEKAIKDECEMWAGKIAARMRKLDQRVEALELICAPIEGLAELSKPLSIDSSKESLIQPPDELPSELRSELPSELRSEPPDELPALTQTELARRLGCHKSMISRHKGSDNFEEWSKGKDPDAIAWRYDRKIQKFYPVEGDL